MEWEGIIGMHFVPSVSLSVGQRLRSHKTFKGQSTHAHVRAITHLCIDGLPSNLVQILLLIVIILCSYIQEYFGYQ